MSISEAPKHSSISPERAELLPEYEVSVIAAENAGGLGERGQFYGLSTNKGIDAAGDCLRGVLNFKPGSSSGFALLVSGNSREGDKADVVVQDVKAYLESLDIENQAWTQEEAREKLDRAAEEASQALVDLRHREGSQSDIEGAQLSLVAVFQGDDNKHYLASASVSNDTLAYTHGEGAKRLFDEKSTPVDVVDRALFSKYPVTSFGTPSDLGGIKIVPLSGEGSGGKWRIVMDSGRERITGSYALTEESESMFDQRVFQEKLNNLSLGTTEAAKEISAVPYEETVNMARKEIVDQLVPKSRLTYVIDFEVKKKQPYTAPSESPVTPQHPDDEPLVVRGRAVPASERRRVRRQENAAAERRREKLALPSLNGRKFARGIMRYAIYAPFVAGQNWRWQAMSAEEYNFSSRSRKIAAAVGGVASKAILIGGLSYFMKNGWHMPDMPNLNPFDNDHPHTKPSPTPSGHPTQSPPPEATEPKPSVSPSPEKTHPGSGEGGQPPQQDHSPHPADKPDLKAERVEVKSRTWSQGADEGRLSVEERGDKIIISAQGMNHDPTQANITIDHHQYIVDLDTNGEVVIDKHTAFGHILEGNDFDTVEVGDFDAKSHSFHAYATEVGSGDANIEQVTDTNLGPIDVKATETNLNKELAQAGVHGYKVDIAKQGDVYVATILDNKNHPINKNGQPVSVVIGSKELAGTEGITGRLIEKIKSQIK